jgi:hypothetical protein
MMTKILGIVAMWACFFVVCLWVDEHFRGEPLAGLAVGVVAVCLGALSFS